MKNKDILHKLSIAVIVIGGGLIAVGSTYELYTYFQDPKNQKKFIKNSANLICELDDALSKIEANHEKNLARYN